MGHGTTTAKLIIDKQIADMEENKAHSLILATDLSKAYDLIDHQILIRKLEHHGVKKDSLELIGSFFENMSYFIDIQGFRSKKKNLNGC